MSCVRYLLDDNGEPIKRNGEMIESQLYNNLVEMAEGDDAVADDLYELVYSDSFGSVFGDWHSGEYGFPLDENGEPVVTPEIYNYLASQSSMQIKPIRKDGYEELSEYTIQDDAEGNRELTFKGFPNFKARIVKNNNNKYSVQSPTDSAPDVKNKASEDAAAEQFRKEINNRMKDGRFLDAISDLGLLKVEDFSAKAQRDDGSIEEPEIKGKNLERLIDKYSIPFAPYGVKVEINDNMKERGRLRYENKIPIVEINSNKVKLDTPLHEFATLYLDLLGGMENLQVSTARDQLKGSDIEREVTELYPDLNKNRMDLEIVATAIGRQEYKNETTLGRILRKILDTLKRLIGIRPDHVAQLARDIESNRLSPEVQAPPYSETFYSTPQNLEELRRKIVERISRKVKIYEKTGSDASLKRLQDLLDEMAKQETEAAIQTFVGAAEKQINWIDERLDDENLGIDDLHTASNYVSAFNILGQAATMVRQQYKSKLSDKELKEHIANIRRVEGLYQDVSGKYREVSLDKIAEIMSSRSSRLKVLKRREYEKDFRRQNKRKADETRSAYDVRAMEYANTKIADNWDSIVAEQKQTFKDWLRTAPRDISAIESFLVDPRNLSDPVIQTFVNQLDEVDFYIKMQFNNNVKDIQDKVEDYLKETKSGDQRKIWEPFLELDEKGKPTGYLLSKYLSSYKEGKKKYFDKVRKKYGERNVDNVDKWDRATDHWYKNEKPKYINKRWTALMDPKKDKDKKTQRNRDILASFRKRITEDDAATRHRQSLIRTYDKRGSEPVTTIALPSVRKNTMERMKESGVLGSFKRGFNDVMTRNQNDIEFGEANQRAYEGIEEVLATESDEEFKTIPIFFRGEINNEDRSFDIPSALLLNNYSSLNYSEKSKQMSTAEILKDLLYERDVSKTSGVLDALKVSKNEKGRLFKDKGESNAYKALKSLVEHRIYGVAMIDPGNVGNTSVGKLSKQIAQWTGDTMLMLNYFSMGPNLMHGATGNFIESVAGRYLTRGSLKRGHAKYFGDMGNIMADIGSERYRAKTNLLMERMDTLNNSKFLKNEIGDTSRSRRLFNRSTLHATTIVPEHYIHNVMMLSVLDDLKPIGKDGKVLKDKNGKEMNLSEAFTVENNRIKLDSRVKGTTRFGKGDAEFQASQLIRKINADLHGNYDPDNKSMAQRTVLGSFAFMMRKWMVRGVQRRYRGWSTVFKRKEHDPYYNTFVSEELEGTQEGIYITGIKFIRDLFQSRDNLLRQGLSQNLNNMTKEERANLRAFTAEISTIMLSYGAYFILSRLADAGDDEEDKQGLLLTTFYFRRLISEYRFYTSIREPLRIISSPAASMSFLRRVGHLFNETLWLSNFEEYETGPYAGTYKIHKDIADVTPVWNVLTRDVAMALSYIESFGGG